LLQVGRLSGGPAVGPNETLFNLGLPPVREEGERGFLTYDTNEGRLHAPVETPADPRTVL
jgi:hypothetical protein